MREFNYLVKSFNNKKYAFFYEFIKDINHNNFDFRDIINRIFKYFELNYDFMLFECEKDFSEFKCSYKQNPESDEVKWITMKRNALKDTVKNEKLTAIDGFQVVPMRTDTKLFFLVFNHADNNIAEEHILAFEMLYLVLRTVEMNQFLLIYPMIDALTGAYNFNTFQRGLSTEIAKIERATDDITFSLIVFDIDCLNDINKIGYSYGDKVLQHIANCIKKQIRATDAYYRIGDDEFAVIANLADKETARDFILKRITNEIERKDIMIGDTVFKPSVKCAIVEYQKDKNISKTELMKQMYSALDEAKLTKSVVVR